MVNKSTISVETKKKKKKMKKNGGSCSLLISVIELCVVVFFPQIFPPFGFSLRKKKLRMVGIWHCLQGTTELTSTAIIKHLIGYNHTAGNSKLNQIFWPMCDPCWIFP